MFIFEREWAEEGQRDTEPEAGTGLKLKNLGIMTRAEVGHLTDWAIQVPLEGF